jgi:transcriptional regulator with XRE-family HTH domain
MQSTMGDISVKFGKRVKEIRLKKGYSQGSLAKLLEVHPSDISGIERGKRNMSLKNIERLAKALGVTIEELIK